MNKRMTMVLASLLSVIGADVCAQEVADSVWVDSVEVDSVALAEEFKSDYDSEEDKARMDSLIQARYVLVFKNGKCGIYDQEKDASVTAVDMDYIEYSHYSQPEGGMCFCYFYYEKGLQCGEIGINMSDNTKVETLADNPELVGKVEDYPTIDSLISARSCDVLRECMTDIDGIQGQMAVIDARTADVLAWGALENVEGDIVYAPLLKKMCNMENLILFAAAECLAKSGTSLEDSVDTGPGILMLSDSVWIKDHNWRKGGYGMLTYKQALLNKSRIGMYHAMMTLPDGKRYWKCATNQIKSANAMEMATLFNDIFHLDSVYVSAEERSNFREIAIGMFKEGGIQHMRASKDVELAGVYNVADDGTEQTFTFVGCFPVDNPKYAVSMVILRKHKLPAWPSMVSDKVNGLIEWLNKK